MGGSGKLESMSEAHEFWEQFYSADGHVWSGQVNAQLAKVAAGLPVGRALDLGCGEGADAIWLAERGWQVVAVDIAEAALERARSAASQRKLLASIDFERHDLAVSFPVGRYDLVSAQFLHSPVPLDRVAVLRHAAAAVAVGGRLVIVDHAAAPPGAGEHAHHHHFATIPEVLAGLRLDTGRWQRVQAETVDRRAVRAGRAATFADNVIVLQRTGEDGYAAS